MTSFSSFCGSAECAPPVSVSKSVTAITSVMRVKLISSVMLAVRFRVQRPIPSKTVFWLGDLLLVQLIDETRLANLLDHARIPEIFLAELLGARVIESGHLKVVANRVHLISHY